LSSVGIVIDRNVDVANLIVHDGNQINTGNAADDAQSIRIRSGVVPKFCVPVG
jgi:hypothetical protein